MIRKNRSGQGGVISQVELAPALILRSGGESQLHPQANSFFLHVFFLERSQKLGTVVVQEEAGFSSNLHPPRVLVLC